MDEFTAIGWDWEDLLKMAFALIAGVILGMEREWKDKSAGFKTISIICLGSTLFTLLSYKLGSGDSEDATRIASYVVSGIGFLGAGVIFKEGGNVNGLTTASIIWISAAIGMSIGFGQYITSGVFLLACFLIIISGSMVSKTWVQNVAKTVEIRLNSTDLDVKSTLHSGLKKRCSSSKLKQTHFTQTELVLVYDIVIRKQDLNELERFLLAQLEIESFSY